MSDATHAGGGSGPTHRSVEIGVAIAMLIFSLIVIVGSIQAGIDWASDGPRAGFFPFYCACFVLVASSVNLFQAVGQHSPALFAEWGQLGRVMQVVVPGAIFVGLVPWLGIYVPAALLIAVFMRWIGGYGWTIIAAIPVPVMIATYFIFERWFLVPLPKGPLEYSLGL